MCLKVHKGTYVGVGEYIDEEGIQLLVLPTEVVLAGSNQPKDWLRNFDAKLVPGDMFGTGKIHRGFKRYAEKAWSYIEDLLEKRPFMSFYGHSQGGSVASLLALLYKNKYPSSSVSIITYGAPAFSDEKFTTNFKKTEYTRFVHSYDVVTSLPLSSKYKHPVKVTRIGITGWKGRLNTAAFPVRTHWHSSYIKEIEKW